MRPVQARANLCNFRGKFCRAKLPAPEPDPEIFTAKSKKSKKLKKPEKLKKFYRSGLCGVHHLEMILQ
jgi:hypothetical protein